MTSANSSRIACMTAAGITLLSIGCTNRVADLTLISTRQVNLSTLQMEPKLGRPGCGEPVFKKI